MKFIACSVFDSKAKAFLPAWFVVNQAVAQRAFADIAVSEGHQIARNPEDFTLYVIGTFDDDTGELRPYPQHINLGLASSYLKDVSSVSIHEVREAFKVNGGNRV